MNSSAANKKMLLDKNVWLVMLLTIILSLGLISYRLVDKKSCTPFEISAKSITNKASDQFEVGETVIFKASSPEQKEITWEFGDGSNEQETVGTSLRHKFMKEGVFTVLASINSGCSEVIKVTIKKSENVDEEEVSLTQPKIYGNTNPIAGIPEQYLSEMIGSSYEWKVLNKINFPSSSEQRPFFTFPKPGLYVLQLTVDHDRKKRSVLEITVDDNSVASAPKKPGKIPILIPEDLRQPPKTEESQKSSPQTESQNLTEKQAEKQPEAKAAEPSGRKIFNIIPAQLKSRLQEVVEGELSAEDFDNYFWYGGETAVWVNNEKKSKKFRDFCREIRGKKLIIEDVEIKKDDNNYVQQIKVKYSKKGFLKNIL